MKRLLLILLLSVAVSAQTTHTFGALDTNNNWTGINVFTQIVPGYGTFAQMQAWASPPAQMMWIMTDATSIGSCAAGGGGYQSLCVYYNGNWVAVAGSGGSGSGTVSNCTQYAFGEYLATGTTIGCAPNLSEPGGTLLNYAGSQGVQTGLLTLNGTGAGQWSPTCQTPQQNESGAGIIDFTVPTSCTHYMLIFPNAPGTAGQRLGIASVSGTKLMLDWESSSGGTVTVTGSPSSGNLTKFSGASSITNGDLSGDVTTSGTLATTLASSGVTPGSYTNASITIDAKGRVTSASSGSGITTTIASGTAAMGTSAISANTCATTVTVTATGVATTDAIISSPNTNPTAVTGYGPTSSEGLYIDAWPTSGNVNFKVCNGTANSITPGALTLNWRVVR